MLYHLRNYSFINLTIMTLNTEWHDGSISYVHSWSVRPEKHANDANYKKLFFRRHEVSCLLLSSDQIIRRSSPVQRSRCRDGVSIRFRIWRLYDLSWRNRRCLVLLINNQVLDMTCSTRVWSLCRLRSSDLSTDKRLILCSTRSV